MAGRPERPVKRLRRLSTDHDDSESTVDWTSGKEQGQSHSSISTNRPRRAAAQASAVATANAAARDRETDSPDELRLPGPSSVKLKVGSRLREVDGLSSTGTSGTRRGGKAGATSIDSVEGTTGRRAHKKAIIEDSSEEDEDEEDDEEENIDGDGDEDENEDQDDEEEEDDEDDAEAEDDEDIDMDDAPPPQSIKFTSSARPNPSVTVTPAQDSKLRSVEDQEMAMGNSDDDELSELDSLQEMEDQEGGELDGEGEDDDELDGEDIDAEADSDDESPDTSRLGTPDPSKLTRRQRGEAEGALMALSNEAQKKKHLTAEEHQARRAEMARRRKNLSEKRNEEEKMDTINRLLKKQAPKRRSRKEIEAEAMEEAMERDEWRSSALYVRWTNDTAGSRVGVPDEILSADNVSVVFKGGVTGGKVTSFKGRMVEEIPIEAS